MCPYPPCPSWDLPLGEVPACHPEVATVWPGCHGVFLRHPMQTCKLTQKDCLVWHFRCQVLFLVAFSWTLIDLKVPDLLVQQNASFHNRSLNSTKIIMKLKKVFSCIPPMWRLQRLFFTCWKSLPKRLWVQTSGSQEMSTVGEACGSSNI